MRIAAGRAWRVDMPLAEPYEIARGSYERAVNVFLCLECGDGTSGYGCAAPDREVTGETVRGAERSLAQLAESLVGKNPLRRARILEQVAEQYPNEPAVLSAVDLALCDLLGKRSGLPLWQILGGYRSRIRTSVTLGILPLAETLERGDYWWRQGFRALKVKGGIDPELDAERVCRLRERLGSSLDLRFDANQGYTARQSIEFVSASKSARISVLEQPTVASDLELLGEIKRRVKVPVMADESLQTLQDAFRLVRGRLCDVVNIKLMKVGGLSEAMRINALARSAGIDVMVGCGDESALGIVGALHFALASGNVAYADLDGHFDLDGDPFAGTVVARSGWLSVQPAPGLGAVIADSEKGSS